MTNLNGSYGFVLTHLNGSYGSVLSHLSNDKIERDIKMGLLTSFSIVSGVEILYFDHVAENSERAACSTT